MSKNIEEWAATNKMVVGTQDLRFLYNVWNSPIKVEITNPFIIIQLKKYTNWG